jgi:hypothetical protein
VDAWQRNMGQVLPHDSATAWTPDEERSGRRAFDDWRFAETDRLIPWDWADMGAAEKRQWIDRGKSERAAWLERRPPRAVAQPPEAAAVPFTRDQVSPRSDSNVSLGA